MECAHSGHPRNRRMASRARRMDSDNVRECLHPLSKIAMQMECRHGRDNKLNVWRILRMPEAVGSAANANMEHETPELSTSVDINALNFCRFSFIREESGHALVAVPNLVDSSLVRSAVGYMWHTLIRSISRRTCGSFPVAREYMRLSGRTQVGTYPCPSPTGGVGQVR
jgi:hypothetical protein